MIETDWYAPQDIFYTRAQTRWLLKYADMLREGHYPPEGRETGYAGSSHQSKESAPFERVCQIIAEVDIRLSKIGLDRELVEAFYTDGLSVEDIAKRYNLNYEFVIARIDSGLNYIASGPVQRWSKFHKHPCTYKEWLSRGNSRRKYSFADIRVQS